MKDGPVPRWPLLVLGLGYTAMLVYGTLFPLSGWHEPVAPVSQLFLDSLRAHQSRADLLTNLLIYMPFGLAIAIGLQTAVSRAVLLVVAASAGFALSLALEITQSFLPGRTPSLFDLGLNTIGSLVGALFPRVFEKNQWVGAVWSRWRADLVESRAGANIALVAVGFWALSQLTPFVPSIDIGNLRQGLSPLRQAVNNPAIIESWRTAMYALSILGFGALVLSFALDRQRVFRFYVVFVSAVLLLKVPIIMRQLSAEALIGAAVAFAALYALQKSRLRSESVALAALITGVVVSALRPDPAAAATLHQFGWTLFASQMLSINGFQDILETAAPPLALAAIALRADPSRWAVVAWGGGAVLMLGATMIEWAQLSVPGRVAEISDIVVATGAWCSAWLVAFRRSSVAGTDHPPARNF